MLFFKLNASKCSSTVFPSEIRVLECTWSFYLIAPPPPPRWCVQSSLRNLNATLPPGPPVSSCVLIKTQKDKKRQRSQYVFVTASDVSHSE